MSKFKCAICGETFERSFPKEEAVAELNENFPGFAPEDCDLVCGACYKDRFEAAGPMT